MNQGTYRNRFYRANQYEEKPNQKERHSAAGLRLRLVLSMFLMTAYLLLPIGQKEQIQKALRPDYSENVFDFITELAYTLDYEKISIK